VKDQKKLLERVRKIGGQVEALERLLSQTTGESEDVSLILQTVASARGALNGLMCELIEGHIREHILAGAEVSALDRERAVEDVVEVVKRYLK
jgi:DNA-binding FrmR family transcriptional regulator